VLDLNNINMKRPILVILLSILVLAALLVWLLSPKQEFNLEEIGMFAALVIVSLGMIIFGIRRYKSVRSGEPFEDELSKRIMRRATSTSYLISLYWWLALSYFSDNWEYETGTVIGIGIGGMAVIFFISWIYFKVTGLKNG